MWSTIVSAVLVGWSWLPEVTIGLKFATALIVFVLTVPLFVRRVRRWLRRPVRR
ncbi:hypothetical protein SAMN05421812_114125 [Asanoa hainanensis]|uniref:Uncharacterized protein n=1 Tax=Asanoa hainanensis TaxID=560556 RepID=A0A239P661_9ACTN|nr:hypothetical protein [Asanoa hainanensis]SNT62595.1 hypothetical protein SAMN05421812_114125 [Asanoa hainanensis]